MSRHIVGALHRMGVIRLVLRHDMVENPIHIGAYIRISILVDCQTAGSMLHENVQQSGLGKLTGKPAEDFARYKMAAAPHWRHPEFYLLYHLG